MNRRGLAQGVIDVLPEPTFLLASAGGIVGMNRAARLLLGRDGAGGSGSAGKAPPEDQAEGDAGSDADGPGGADTGGGAGATGGDLADRLVTPRDELDRYLARCRGTTTPIPGSLVFAAPDGERRLRVHCARVPGNSGGVVLLLRCADPRGDRFAVLAERVRMLDADLRQRAREKAVLREALDENRNLMRELQHRVKNNIQMMISLLSMSAVNGASADVRAVVDRLRDRFHALATTQDLIYEAQSVGDVSARELFGRLVRALSESIDGAIDLQTEIEDVRVPQESAHCLALIVNELVTNSFKYGAKGGAGTIRIALERDAGQIRLSVQDNGTGYPDLASMPRSSGLTLVRGLCRQIGAALELDNDGGARTVVSFAESGETAAPASAARRHEAAGTQAST